MKYVKKLSGRLCYLSPMSRDDASIYTEWLNEIETTRFLTLVSSNISYEVECEALESLSREHNYAIVDQQTDTLIGSCGLMSIDHLHATAEAGIFIGNTEYRNQGVGTEALRLLCTYAVDYLNVKSILIRVYDFNEAAQKCYEKVGFKRIGVWREALEQCGKRHGIVLMDCTPEDLDRLS